MTSHKSFNSFESSKRPIENKVAQDDVGSLQPVHHEFFHGISWMGSDPQKHLHKLRNFQNTSESLRHYFWER